MNKIQCSREKRRLNQSLGSFCLHEFGSPSLSNAPRGSNFTQIFLPAVGKYHSPQSVKMCHGDVPLTKLLLKASYVTKQGCYTLNIEKWKRGNIGMKHGPSILNSAIIWTSMSCWH